MKLQLHQQWHSKMADRTPSRWQQCETRRSPESLPSGMVLFSISFCFSSGSAGKAAQRGERGGREKQKTMRRSKKYFSVERGFKSKREEIWGYQRLTGRIKKTQAARKLLTIFKNCSISSLSGSSCCHAGNGVTVCVFFTANWQPELPILTSGSGVSGWWLSGLHVVLLPWIIDKSVILLALKDKMHQVNYNWVKWRGETARCETSQRPVSRCLTRTRNLPKIASCYLCWCWV